ncbi:efflux RND transporter periplasmic adaptor subunit [Janthinobacterium agaricidamnosum]|uniref:Efflux RND transporter periplasmic adaptor subunit n=1 Tax=Janthinobacterium agaricidamnosum TaxID=55508 RepID=A0A3G2EAN6_9BURK|nr:MULTISPECIES: efflux RND transporter periplasmic adaptor subunit [Janthinobacterium]AYM76539.1 efflux RND transporter periplasmic adaptor subunit [Janthinobacterium agaricidamnosum]PJJ06755.1 cobalt-zinc-cadmium efflux system membrane fusion protein [Janthinobacterium sp. 67]
MKTPNIEKKSLRAMMAIVAIGAVLLAAILFTGKSGGAPEGTDTETTAKADEKEKGVGGGAGKGSHGGKLFVQGATTVEVILAEEKGEARHRLWLYENGKPVAPTTATATEQIKRADGQVMNFEFAVDKDSLLAKESIAEPHIFDALITVRKGGVTIPIKLQSEEGKIELTDAQIKTAGVMVAKSGTASINSAFQLAGEVRFNEDRTAHIVPRLQGVVESVAVDLGQQVKKGQVLAIIASTVLSEMRSESLGAQKRLAMAKLTYDREKKLWEDKISAEQDYLQAQQGLREAEIAAQNASQKIAAIGASGASSGALNRFELRAPFDGAIIEKHITLGESVAADVNVFTIADLSTVWAEIIVPAKDLGTVRVGTKALVKATTMDSEASGVVSYVGSLLGEQTRTAKARVTLANPKLAWRPGLFVNVDMTSDEREVPVAVASDAIQTVEGSPAVYIRIDGGFFAQPVETGRSDGKYTEIVKGLAAGTTYAAKGSFVLKAEQGKDSAEHAH